MSLFSWLISWGPVVIWAGLIFYLSSIPGLSTGWGVYDLILRKAAHMTEYAVLTFLVQRAIRRTWSIFRLSGVLVVSFLFSFLYAISDEFHQGFVPGRTPSVVDVFIDSVGIIAFIVIFVLYQKRMGTDV
jgi:VanZ family protein